MVFPSEENRGFWSLWSPSVTVIHSPSGAAKPRRTGAIRIWKRGKPIGSGLSKTTQRSSQEKDASKTGRPGRLKKSFSLRVRRSRAMIRDLLGSVSLYFWRRTTDPSDEKPNGVHRLQTCSGSPPTAETMKPHGNGSSEGAGVRPFLQSRSKITRDPSGEIEV